MEPLGPYTFDDVVELYKKGELKVDSFIWHPEFSEDLWKRLFEVEEFKELLLRYPRCFVPKKRSKGISQQLTKVDLRFANKKGEYGVENEYRRYPRAPINAKAFLKNDSLYVDAICVDISEKGAFIEITDLTAFETGEEVTLTIYNNEHLETFSINSVIINSIRKNGSNGYGVYFLRLNPQRRRKIAEYVVNKLRESSAAESKAS